MKVPVLALSALLAAGTAAAQYNQGQPQTQGQPQYQGQPRNQNQPQYQGQPQYQNQGQPQGQAQPQYQGQGQPQYQNQGQPPYQGQGQPQYQNQGQYQDRGQDRGWGNNPWRYENNNAGTYRPEWDRLPPPRRGACFFTDANFNGHRFCVRSGDRLSSLPQGYGHSISSIRAFGGARITAFTRRDFQGERADFSNAPDLGYTSNGPRRGWNDRIGSVVVQ